MNYYVVQVHTGQEEKFLRAARDQVANEERDADFDPSRSRLAHRFHWPRRKLFVRKRGRTREQVQPIFPGYVFLEAEAVSERLYWMLRRTPNFVRILKDNQNIQPLSAQDTQLLLHFLGFGEVVGVSRVTFDENSRIHVVNGPLAGLEGRIVKVDKRKRRAKVKLDMYNDSFLIDFGFEDMTRISENSGV